MVDSTSGTSNNNVNSLLKDTGAMASHFIILIIKRFIHLLSIVFFIRVMLGVLNWIPNNVISYLAYYILNNKSLKSNIK